MATEPDCVAAGPDTTRPSIAASKPLHQYQHFIPQFLLKNFAHKYVAPDSLDTTKGKKRNAKTGMYSGEPAVNTLHLSGDFYLEECAVRRTCGIEDMYEDAENLLKDHGHLEKKFAAIESKASLIYRKIVKTYKNGKDNICLTRKENDFLRKFMFLLTLRSVQYHRKYNLDRVQDYDGDDKVWLQEFMEAYGLTKPLDVWLQSLEIIIDVEIDPAGIWVELIKNSIYFPIADTFIDHMNKMYMTICTPEDHVDEFILTDNCCNVTEGKIAAYHIEAMMNHVDLAPCFHRFAPISPKLMIVLRYNLLPESIDSENPVATVRQTQNGTGFDNGNQSILENLPIRKAMITPMEEVNGHLVPRIGSSQKLGLFQFMRREGRDIPFKWPFELNEDGDLDQLHIRKVATTKFLEHPNHGKDGTGLDHKTLYQKLGGTDETFTSDMAAATIMFETWTMSVDLNYGSPEYEYSCRKKLERLLTGHQGQSNTRFWLFLKKMRLGQAVANRAVHSVQGVALLVKPECQGSEDVLAYAHSIVSDKELNVAMYKAFNESIVMVRGAGNGLESMGHFSLFGSKKWRTSKPSGRGEPREVDKKKKEKNNEEMVRPALPDDTKGEASTEPACENKQLDVKEKRDDDKESTCSLQPENADETASTEFMCTNKQLDAKEKSDDDKKEPSSGIEEPTKTCDDDKTKDEDCGNNIVCIEDTSTPSSLDEGTKKEEQTDPVIEDEHVLQKTPTKAVARKEKAHHTLPDNKKMWYVCAATVACLVGSLGLFVLGALGYLVSPVLRRFVWLLDNIAVASNNLRFVLFPLAKNLLYVAIILIAFILGMTTMRKVFRK
ncbi:uncharacterized protein T069G_10534 [Trichoderma breve]|uniref:DUF4238 domain-containing protein n=1 Tax=Trichoderma breve TaxID=2034170 RepID=A0A9W9E525_9HYPO|nr:uncharacterized protein T069G_10534 [Trichoderma breve]KAJ4854976.1 hypothetical protein T069G_10534 [Trichoderma breve]